MMYRVVKKGSLFEWVSRDGYDYLISILLMHTADVKNICEHAEST